MNLQNKIYKKIIKEIPKAIAQQSNENQIINRFSHQKYFYWMRTIVLLHMIINTNLFVLGYLQNFIKNYILITNTHNKIFIQTLTNLQVIANCNNFFNIQIYLMTAKLSTLRVRPDLKEKFKFDFIRPFSKQAGLTR